MGLKITTVALAVSFILGCSKAPPDPPAPRQGTVFDPLTQQLDRAKDVQRQVDQNTDAMRKATDAQERGDEPPPDSSH